MGTGGQLGGLCVYLPTKYTLLIQARTSLAALPPCLTLVLEAAVTGRQLDFLAASSADHIDFGNELDNAMSFQSLLYIPILLIRKIFHSLEGNEGRCDTVIGTIIIQ